MKTRSIKGVKHISYRVSFPLVLVHALLITFFSTYMVMSLPSLG